MLATISAISTAADAAQFARALRARDASGLVRSSVDLVGLDTIINGMLRLIPHLVSRTRRLDVSTLDELLARMRADVPRDSGRLFNGIQGSIDGDMAVVEASAVKPKGRGEGADYAGFVEIGTKAGHRGRQTVADEAYFTRDQWTANNPGSDSHPGRQFRSGRTLRRIHDPHPGTPAQPYFWDNVRDVMAERGAELEAAQAAEAQALGFAAL